MFQATNQYIILFQHPQKEWMINRFQMVYLTECIGNRRCDTKIQDHTVNHQKSSRDEDEKNVNHPIPAVASMEIGQDLLEI